MLARTKTRNYTHHRDSDVDAPIGSATEKRWQSLIRYGPLSPLLLFSSASADPPRPFDHGGRSVEEAERLPLLAVDDDVL